MTASPATPPHSNDTDTPSAATRLPQDRVVDMRTMLLTVGLLVGTLALSATLQAVIVLDVDAEVPAPTSTLDVLRRLLVNFTGVASALIMVNTMNLPEYGPRASAWRIAVISATTVAIRAVLQVGIGIYALDRPVALLTDAVVTIVMVGLALAFARWTVSTLQRARIAERREILPAVRARDGLAEMQRTELARRRENVDRLGIHLQSGLRRTEDELTDMTIHADPLTCLRLEQVRAELTRLRTSDVQRLSRSLHPEDVHRGLVPALEALARRAPHPIDVRVAFDSHAARATPLRDDVLPLDRRILLVRIAEEGVANALRHGGVLRIDLDLAITPRSLRMTVADDGETRPEQRMRPLKPLRERLTECGGELQLTSSPARRNELIAHLPLARNPSPVPG